MPGNGVITRRTVGDFPRVDICVLVVIHKAFNASVQVEQVGVAYLFPATAALAYRGGVPTADVRR